MEKDIQCQPQPPWAHGMCTHPHEHIHIPLTHLHKEIPVQIHSTRVKRKKGTALEEMKTVQSMSIVFLKMSCTSLP